MKRAMPFGGYALSLAVALFLDSTSIAEETSTPRLVKVWDSKLKQQYEADGICKRDGFVYLGTGGADSKIVKLRVSDGAVAWTWSEQPPRTYQPSYPVSNGSVVVFGQYGGAKIIGLDDAAGKQLWETQASASIMSAGCFVDDLALIASNDGNLYAIEWSTGAIRWKAKVGRSAWSRPCILEGEAFVGSYDGFLYGVDLAGGMIKTKIDCGGWIKYDPVASNGLIFTSVDHQRVTDAYDINNARKEMAIIDPRQGRIIEKLQADRRFSGHIFPQQNVVYFVDCQHLYAYDTTERKLAWKAAVPASMRPFPIFRDKEIVFAMNESGREGQHASDVMVIDRTTGKEVGRKNTGGIGIQVFGHYCQDGDLVLTTDHRLVCYKLVSSGQDE